MRLGRSQSPIPIGGLAALHRLLVRVAAGARAAALLAELDKELLERLSDGDQALGGWYRRECRSLARWYAAVRLRRLTRLARNPTSRRLPADRSPMSDRFLQDARCALRSVRMQPGFSAFIIGTLAIGIGLNAAMYSVVNAVLVRPLELLDADRLVRVWSSDEVDGERYLEASSQDFFDFAERARSLERITAFSTVRRPLADEHGSPTHVVVGRVAADFLATIGARPQLGRGFTPEEHAAGAAVAMLSQEHWHQRYGGNAGAVGSTILLDESPYTVVGVVPRAWSYPPQVQVWRPFDRDELGYEDDDRELIVIGRLRSEVDLIGADRELGVIAAELAIERPDANAGLGAWVEPFRATTVRNVRMPLLMLLGAVSLVLLAACVNVAALLLARAAQRQHEMSVRSALGATRARMIRQALAESFVLAGIGGAAGTIAGGVFLRLILATAPAELPRAAAIGLDARVVVVCAAATVLTGLLFGLVPAIHGSLPDVRRGLGFAGRRGSNPGTRGQRALVVVEITTAVILTVGAALLLRSFDELVRLDRGFAPAGVLSVRVDVPDSLEDEDPLALYERVRERVAALPGVKSTAIGRTHPLEPLGINLRVFEPAGLPEPIGAVAPNTVVRMISPSYFDTAGIPLQAGRVFTSNDGGTDAGVAIVNQAFVRAYFGTAETVGQTFELPWRSAGTTFEIVGVVGDVIAELTRDPHPALYFPFAQMATHGVQLLVAADADLVHIAPLVRQAIWSAELSLPLGPVVAMEQLLDDQAAGQRFQSRLVSTFAIVALALAALGIYGVVSLGVSRRTRELGIRQALGAEQRAVRRLVLAEGLRLVGVGAVFGLIGAYALSNALRSLLFEVSPTDPTATAAVVAVVVIAAMAASWLPARRAARVDPVRALQAD